MFRPVLVVLFLCVVEADPCVAEKVWTNWVVSSEKNPRRCFRNLGDVVFALPNGPIAYEALVVFACSGFPEIAF